MKQTSLIALIILVSVFSMSLASASSKGVAMSIGEGESKDYIPSSDESGGELGGTDKAIVKQHCDRHAGECRLLAREWSLRVVVTRDEKCPSLTPVLCTFYRD